MNAHRAICPRPPEARRGQALIFIVLAVVILAFVVLFVFDLHKTLFVKTRSRNAGDAAALAAARWQGIALNLVGDLNLMQAVAVSQALTIGADPEPVAAVLGDLAARVNFVAPLIGFAAAQQAAKNNGMFVNPAFTRALLNRAAEVANEYPRRYPLPPYRNDPDPPTAWDDYAGMLAELAAGGVAAAVDNPRYYQDYANWHHDLLNPDFYDAIASQSWCWFFFNARALLDNYQSWRDWPGLPLVTEPTPINAEFFGLGLRRVASLERLGYVSDSPEAADLLARLSALSGAPLQTGVLTVATTWLAYDDSRWAAWTATLPPDFPFDGAVRPAYNYAGADAAVRLEASAERLSPGAELFTVQWTAAAKPFGHLNADELPTALGLVLPAFHAVRLIPVDASSAPAPGSQAGWGLHVYEHLPTYVAYGPEALAAACWYCRQLRTWENHAFRAEGRDWLEENSDTCRRRGPGSGPGGGTRRPH